MTSHMGHGVAKQRSPHSTVRICSVHRRRDAGLSKHSRFRCATVSSRTDSSTWSLSTPVPFTFASVHGHTHTTLKFLRNPPFRDLSHSNAKASLHISLALMQQNFAAILHDSRLAFLQLSANHVEPDLTKKCSQHRSTFPCSMPDSRLKPQPTCISTSDANPCTRVAHHFRPPMDKTCWEEPLRKAPSRTLAEPAEGSHTKQWHVWSQGVVEASMD